MSFLVYLPQRYFCANISILQNIPKEQRIACYADFGYLCPSTKMTEQKKNYLAFSLWGTQPIYTVGAVSNAMLVEEIYPGWQMVLYHDETVPTDILTRLAQYHVRLIDMSDSGIFGPFWRFLAADIPDCAYAVFRDTDSRITLRERHAVEEWITDATALHVMRDHPYHAIPYGAEKSAILAGMWGIKGGVLPMEELIRDFIKDKTFYYGIDQTFLQHIYEALENDQTLHDEFFGGKRFPEKRTGYQFVGERIDEHGQPVGEDREILKRHLNAHSPSFLSRIKKLVFK